MRGVISGEREVEYVGAVAVGAGKAGAAVSEAEVVRVVRRGEGSWRARH